MFLARAILTFALLFASTASAQIHVGPGQPYADLGAACQARVIIAGDTVYLHAGTYRNSSGTIDSLIGRPDAWITIRPFGNDSVSIHEQYTIFNARYLRISGLRFYGDDPTQRNRVYHQLYFDYAYDCFNAVHDIIVENCIFTDLNNAGKGGSGACLKFAGVDRFLVENCVFRNGTNMADGIGMNADRNGIIRHCTFENLPGFGSHCKGGAKHITYEKNLFVNCIGGGIEAGGDTGPAFFCPLDATWEADSIKIYSNVFIGGLTGVRLAGCHNSVVYNNTTFKATQWAFRLLNASSRAKVDNNRIYNNIFIADSPYGIYMNASANHDYSTHYFKNNLFHDYRRPDPSQISWAEMPGINVEGSIIGDPLFLDTARRNFELKTGSPAISAGITIDEPTTDYRDKPFLPARSIGAYESGEQLKVGAYAETSLLLKLWPNPSTGVVTVGWEQRLAPRTLHVYDNLGKLLLTHVVRGGTAELDLRGLASGEYLILAKRADGEAIASAKVLRR